MKRVQHVLKYGLAKANILQKQKTKITDILTMVLLLILFNKTYAATTFHYNDGKVHDINSRLRGCVAVESTSSGKATTVNFLNGANASAFGDSFVKVYNNSYFNLMGGSIEGHSPSNYGNIIGSLYGYDNSIITISSGYIGMNAYFSGSSKATITDVQIGDFLNQVGTLNVKNNSSVLIEDGIFDVTISTADNGKITINGGQFGNYIDAGGLSEIIISGSGFNYDYGRIDSEFGVLTGTLDNGDVINSQFHSDPAASIILIPEPASILLLGLGGLVLRRRK